MPPARSATSTSASARSARAARSQQRRKPHAVAMRLPISGIRWDRKLRTTMLVVLALVGWIGVRGISTLISTRAQAEQEHALVTTLARENHQLAAQAQSLRQPATIMTIARSLGMVKAGERPFVVTGLSNR
jgi:cell division protein FtsB